MPEQTEWDAAIEGVKDAALFTGRTMAQSSLMKWLEQWLDTHDPSSTSALLFIADLIIFVESDMIATDMEHPDVADQVIQRMEQKGERGGA